jgi:hypothetical protein
MKKKEFIDFLDKLKYVTRILVPITKVYSDKKDSGIKDKNNKPVYDIINYYAVTVRFVTDNIYYHNINFAVKNEDTTTEYTYYVNSNPPMKYGAKIDENIFTLLLMRDDYLEKSDVINVSKIDETIEKGETSKINNTMKDDAVAKVLWTDNVFELAGFEHKSELLTSKDTTPNDTTPNDITSK